LTENRAELANEIIRLQQKSHSLGQYASEAWLELDLTISQLKCLFFIDAQGSTNFRNLAKALGVTPPDITRLVDRLVEQGLVSRREHPDDRRMQLLQVTDKGHSLLSKLREYRTTVLQRILTNLSDGDLLTVARGLRALLKAAGMESEQERTT